MTGVLSAPFDFEKRMSGFFERHKQDSTGRVCRLIFSNHSAMVANRGFNQGLGFQSGELQCQN